MGRTRSTAYLLMLVACVEGTAACWAARAFLDDEPGVPTDIRFSTTRMTPVIDTGVGVSYQHAFGGHLVSVGAGYEMTNWFNLEDKRVFTDTYMEAQNAHAINDVSLDGAYFRIALNR